MHLAEVPHGFDALQDGFVMPARGLREQGHGELFGVRGSRRQDQCEETQ